MNRSTAVEILAVPGVPLVCKDDDLVALIGEGWRAVASCHVAATSSC